MERAGSCDYGQLATGRGRLCRRGHVEIPLAHGGWAERQCGEGNGDKVSPFGCFQCGDGASYGVFSPTRVPVGFHHFQPCIAFTSLTLHHSAGNRNSLQRQRKGRNRLFKLSFGKLEMGRPRLHTSPTPGLFSGCRGTAVSGHSYLQGKHPRASLPGHWCSGA